MPQEPKRKQKNQAAVALGRLGGLKGGKIRFQKLSKQERKDFAKKGGEARARKLTARERQDSARKAVLARWKKA